MKIGYVRVSTVEQNEDRQIKAMQEDGVEKYIWTNNQEKISIVQNIKR